jgi:flagellar basal-body rod protein FlgG
MSIQTLYTAATGMQSLETKLDVIANNLANVNTTAFKRDRCNFEDLFYRHLRMPGAQDQLSNLTPTGIQVGLGSVVQSTQTQFQQGGFAQTTSELDLAIEGNGFFQVQDTNGQYLYTRAGNFTVNSQGTVVVGSANIGRVLQPQLQIPPDATSITVSADGIVSITQAGNPLQQQIGQIQLAQFINPQGLIKLGENMYSETNASGPVQLQNPNINGVGTIRQKMLELSNVEPVTELVDLITTQRAFELNSQCVQAGDQVLQLIANLRRF